MLSLGQKILNVEISLVGIGNRKSDLDKVVRSHMLIQQARDDFLEGRLTWSEYLELCESHELNIDTYLNTVEDNLDLIGIKT